MNLFLNLVLIVFLGIIFVLFIFGISYNGYMKGGSWINYILNVMVVCLVYLFYKNREKIKDNVFIIFVSVLIGVMLNFMLVFLIFKVFGYFKDVIVMLLFWSIIVVVGIEVLYELGGIDMMIVFFIIIMGLIGSILGLMLLRFGRFEFFIVKGLMYGNVLYVFGIVKVLEMDIEFGVFSLIGMILIVVISLVLIFVLILLFY